MIQELECKVENSHRQAAQYDPVGTDFSRLRTKPLLDSDELFECFQDGKFHSAEKCIHFLA